MEITFKNAIELLASFQAFLFAAYLLFNSKTRSESNKYIAVFLILLGLNTAINYITYFIDPISSNFSIFLNTTFFLMPASLYLYTKSSLQPNFGLKTIDLIHLAPFIIINIITTQYVYLENLKDNPVETDFHYTLQKAFYVFFYLLIISYQLLSFSFLRRSKELYVENFSNTNTRRYSYLYQLNTIFTVLFLISATKNFFVFSFEAQGLEYVTYIVKFSILLFFCWIIYNGLQSPELFRDDEDIPISVKDILQEEKQNPANSDSELKIEKVRSFMLDNEAFLDPTLSLHSLSRKTNIPSRELSLLINHQLNKHFFDYVNEFRIERAKVLLTNPEKKELTVLEILYDVGFNSKSSFNTAFKKQCGLTPTQYRKNNSLSAA